MNYSKILALSALLLIPAHLNSMDVDDVEIGLLQVVMSKSTQKQLDLFLQDFKKKNNAAQTYQKQEIINLENRIKQMKQQFDESVAQFRSEPVELKGQQKTMGVMSSIVKQRENKIKQDQREYKNEIIKIRKEIETKIKQRTRDIMSSLFGDLSQDAFIAALYSTKQKDGWPLVNCENKNLLELAAYAERYDLINTTIERHNISYPLCHPNYTIGFPGVRAYSNVCGYFEYEPSYDFLTKLLKAHNGAREIIDNKDTNKIEGAKTIKLIDDFLNKSRKKLGRRICANWCAVYSCTIATGVGLIAALIKVSAH